MVVVPSTDLGEARADKSVAVLEPWGYGPVWDSSDVVCLCVIGCGHLYA